jgi:hypothetical protein
MQWLGLIADVLLAIIGSVLLLYAYRFLGKPPGADPEYDAAMARRGPTLKIVGWLSFVMVAIALAGYVVGG